MTRVLCIVQARMSSTRLPGKVLRPILGQPMLAHQIERFRRARGIDRWLVATSDQPSDDPLAGICAARNWPVFRGSLGDVLDRYWQAARTHRPEHVMRLTADCPLIDWELLDQLIELHLAQGNDYSSNAHERSFPDGLDAEIFRFSLLETAWHRARESFQREHVTPYMYSAEAGAKLGVLKDSVDRSWERWTVDYPEDFDFVERVFEALYPSNPAFRSRDIHGLLAREPGLRELNASRRPPGSLSLPAASALPPEAPSDPHS